MFSLPAMAKPALLHLTSFVMASNRNAAIGFIFVTLLIDVIGFGIIIPVMPNLIQELGHADLSHASRIGGWLLFSFAITQFLFSPLVGNLSDRYGRRPVLLASLLGFSIDYLFLAFAPTLAWLFVGRVVAGFTGASMTTASAYIADISTPENRAKNFGVIGAAFGLGFIIGPAIGGLLGGLGTRVPFLVAAGLCLLNFLYGLFILPESLSKENRRPFEWVRAIPGVSLLKLRALPCLDGPCTLAVFCLHRFACRAQQLELFYYRTLWLDARHDWCFAGRSRLTGRAGAGRINKSGEPKAGK
jgi:DHA1 family tetracycline resistance protein-like MFS transporter